MSNKVIGAKSELHAKILPLLQARVKKGQDAIRAERLEQWAKNEEQFRAYIPAKVSDRLRETKRKQGEPQFTTIEIPYSYAVVLTAHTYITSTYLARNPIFQLSGRHGEAENAVMGMEALLDYQVQIGGHIIPMYIWTLDAFKYGLGVMGYYWDKETIRCRKMVEQQETFLGVPIPGKTKKVEVMEELVGYHGTRAYNCRPQDFFFDPAYPASQFQKGEFCGRYVQLSWLDIVDGEKDGAYFNLEDLKKGRTEGTGLRLEGSEQTRLANDTNYTTHGIDDSVGNVEAYEIYVRLIPADWGLGKSKQSEKWVFTLAENRVIIGCRPLGYYHNRFPFEVLEQEIDGHSLFSRSMLEVMKPLSDTLSWLLNTHFYNVRKSLNDQFIVDPSKIMMKDITDPNAGKLIRLKPAAYGTDTRLAVTQFQVHDVTKTHVNDSQMVEQMLQRVSGVNDNIMGMMNNGRKTATEVRSSTTFGINRLKTTAEYMSAMGFAPWTQQIVQVTQQYFDEERKFKIVGDVGQYMTERYINVTPQDIAGFFDFIPVDGTLPVDRFAQVNIWNQIMTQAQAMPAVMQQFDFAKIFAFVAQLAGLKNINQFRVQVVPDAMMQQQAQAGNSVPAVPDQAGVDANGGNVQPPQIPGMGQAL